MFSRRPATGGIGLHEGRDHRRKLEAREQFAALIEKLLAPAGLVGQHGEKFRVGSDLDPALVEDVGRTEPLRIPRRDFAKHPAAEAFAEHFNHQIQMSAHQGLRGRSQARRVS